MVELVWQDPPSRRGGIGKDYSRVIDELKANPGRWALVIKDMKTTAAPAAFRQAKCEATTRRNPDGKTWSVWVRYPATPAPVVRRDAGTAKKPSTAVSEVDTTPPVLPRTGAPVVDDPGLSRYLAERRARGVTDISK